MGKRKKPPKEASEGASEQPSEAEQRRLANLQRGIPAGCYRAADGSIRRLEQAEQAACKAGQDEDVPMPDPGSARLMELIDRLLAGEG